jgi:diacylglycerol kinase (ATP)
VSSPFGPMTLICNTRAGRGRIARELPEIRAQLEKRGLEYDIRYTEHPGHATQIAREVLGTGIKFLVAVGGDGTVHEVVNGIIQDDKPLSPDAVLGVVAAGTGCDFIKTFGIPAMTPHAVAHLDGHEHFRIDIGKVTYFGEGTTASRYFSNIAEAGLGAQVTARARKLPRFLGPMVYLFAFWLTLGRHRPARVLVDLVDRKYQGPMNNLIVANCQFFGGGMRIAPRSAPTDGLLDVQIEHARKRDAIAMMPKVYRGAHLPHPDVIEAKRANVSITSDPPLLIEADGEVLGHTPATFEVRKGAINLKV